MHRECKKLILRFLSLVFKMLSYKDFEKFSFCYTKFLLIGTCIIFTILFPFASNSEITNKGIQSLENSNDQWKIDGWKLNQSIIHPNCFFNDGFSGNFNSEFVNYFAINDYDNFIKNPGLYFGKEIRDFKPIKPSWCKEKDCEKISLITDLKKCLAIYDPKNIVKIDYFIDGYELIKKVKVETCNKLTPNLKLSCSQSFLISIGNYRLKPTVGIYGLFYKNEEPILVPIKFFENENVGINFIESLEGHNFYKKNSNKIQNVIVKIITIIILVSPLIVIFILILFFFFKRKKNTRLTKMSFINTLIHHGFNAKVAISIYDTNHKEMHKMHKNKSSISMIANHFSDKYSNQKDNGSSQAKTVKSKININKKLYAEDINKEENFDFNITSFKSSETNKKDYTSTYEKKVELHKDEILRIHTVINETLYLQTILCSYEEGSLPNEDFVIGYLAGYVDSILQWNKIDKNSTNGMAIKTKTFITQFGKVLGLTIFKRLLKIKSEMPKDMEEGINVGGQDMHNFLKNGGNSPPMNLNAYLIGDEV